MYCGNCGSKVESGTSFCGWCGSPLKPNVIPNDNEYSPVVEEVEETIIEVEEKEKEIISLANNHFIYGVVLLTMSISIILIVSISLGA